MSSASESAPNPLTRDLDSILEQTEALWSELRDAAVFITGGTGFFGRWLLESFLHANRLLSLNAKALVLTRDSKAFARKAPEIVENPAISLLEGDVRSFVFPEGRFSHIVHAAAEASAKLNDESPEVMLDTIVSGTCRVLEFAARQDSPKLLFTSSGAVYGKQPPDITHISEEYLGGPDTMNSQSAYAEGKRIAELLCAIFARKQGIQPKIARCFAFVGPYLPLDTHFAIGNFIRDALAGGPIRVSGDGTPYRSYLYAADLAVWLWTILFKGESCRPYNVGSEEDITILQLAQLIAKLAGGLEVTVAKTAAPGPPTRYVPSTLRARTELGLSQTVSLCEAIQRSMSFFSTHGSSHK